MEAEPRRSRFRYCYNNLSDLSDRRAFYCTHLNDQPDFVASPLTQSQSLGLSSHPTALQI